MRKSPDIKTKKIQINIKTYNFRKICFYRQKTVTNKFYNYTVKQLPYDR